jgi:hypothetical protein
MTILTRQERERLCTRPLQSGQDLS